MKINSKTKMKLSSKKYEQLIHEYQSKISSIKNYQRIKQPSRGFNKLHLFKL